MRRQGIRLAREIAAAVTSGRLVPGARLPTARAAAERLGVGVATVRHAYREAVRAGWLVSGGRGGPRVAPAPPGAEAGHPAASCARRVQQDEVARLAARLGLHLNEGEAARRLASEGACADYDERLADPPVSRSRRAWLGQRFRWAIRLARLEGLGFGEIVSLFEAALAWERCQETARAGAWLACEQFRASALPPDAARATLLDAPRDVGG